MSGVGTQEWKYIFMRHHHVGGRHKVPWFTRHVFAYAGTTQDHSAVHSVDRQLININNADYYIDTHFDRGDRDACAYNLFCLWMSKTKCWNFHLVYRLLVSCWLRRKWNPFKYIGTNLLLYMDGSNSIQSLYGIHIELLITRDEFVYLLGIQIISYLEDPYM